MASHHRTAIKAVKLKKILVLSALLTTGSAALLASTGVIDPGARSSPQSAPGGPLSGLTREETELFNAGKEVFTEIDSVDGKFVSPTFGPGRSAGLGPRFNMNSCAGCHAHPAAGGSAPRINPQVAVARDGGATNVVPDFIKLNGPVRVARFKFAVDANGYIAYPPARDGGVQQLFTITNRADARNCSIAQPNFKIAVSQNNLIFRIPTPLFGLGLVESIEDSTILASHAATASARGMLGIQGHPNRNDNDGTINRYGWKAQNKSLALFSGEAYNVEQGVTNEFFPNERDVGATPLPASCLSESYPEDHTKMNWSGSQATYTAVASDLQKFVTFSRFSAPPAPACDSFNSSACPATVQRGRAVFNEIGCALCHTPELTVGRSVITAIKNQRTARLFSDLLVHRMGSGLADGITQGIAQDDEFRTAPLWGVGQRLFFLHDGRANNLVDAIQQHASSGSEANGVIRKYNQLPETQQQDLINFLRSL